MTGTLFIYALTFMRYSLAITPKNYLLLFCHSINAGAQGTQGYRYMHYHYWDGKEKMGATSVVDSVKEKVAKTGATANDGEIETYALRA